MLTYLFYAFFEDIIDDLVREKTAIKLISIIMMFYFSTLFGLYMHATAKRLNDAGYKTYLLALYTLSIFIIAALFTYLISLQTQLSLILLGSSGFFVSIIAASQAIPFLLQTKAVEKIA